MGVTYTSDQVLALAPDEQVKRDGKKHAAARYWKNLGQSGEAAWGECQGSALYQVRVELTTFAPKCTCPSRKQPCKHVVGLLLLALDAKAVPQAEPPVWVAEWLAKRTAAVEHKQEKKEKEAKKPGEPPSADQLKRIQRREALVAQGLDTLDLWMNDLVRNGLAAVETQPATFWERQASAMVDAQAPGVATRLRLMAGIPGASPAWPEQLLGQMGRLALLTHAYRRGDALDAGVREDVRQLVGWSLKEEEIAGYGDVVSDDWLVLGQYAREEENHLRSQHTWLLGEQSGRPALILQFSYMNAPWKEGIVPGMRQAADLAFWPGADRTRAHFEARRGEPARLTTIPGAASIEAFLAGVAGALARQPWQERFLCALSGVTPAYDTTRSTWYIRDGVGASLRLTGGEYWKLLAVSGGAPVDFAGEWNGEAILPLGVVVEGVYYPLSEVS